MDLFIVKNKYGQILPAYDSDRVILQKVKVDEIYKCSLVYPRNYEFFKKYWAMCRNAHYLLSEENEKKWPTYHALEIALRLEVGHFDPVIRPNGEVDRIPKSISFANQSESEFQEMYDNCLNILLKDFLNNDISIEDFEENLLDFM